VAQAVQKELSDRQDETLEQTGGKSLKNLKIPCSSVIPALPNPFADPARRLSFV
jgi:hypothetical protein